MPTCCEAFRRGLNVCRFSRYSSCGKGLSPGPGSQPCELFQGNHKHWIIAGESPSACGFLGLHGSEHRKATPSRHTNAGTRRRTRTCTRAHSLSLSCTHILCIYFLCIFLFLSCTHTLTHKHTAGWLGVYQYYTMLYYYGMVHFWVYVYTMLYYYVWYTPGCIFILHYAILLWYGTHLGEYLYYVILLWYGTLLGVYL